MLNLKNITKDYVSGDSVVHALRGVSLEFRRNEFVSILGQSGCGKTTLLNIIGGLDKYSDGDLVINSKSTKNFTDRDWDTYRNHSIGFIFQSYNLIPHQTVLSNVELALTLSGVSKKERRERAKQALIKVGLGDQINKKPNQMSGGQMQRVAIARALVNNPDILLADEPTGALDSETSVQIMDLIKEIANDRLVIMVTHNPELAEQYSTRIINLLDGLVVNDSNPYDSSVENAENVKGSVENGEQIATNSDISPTSTEESQKSDTSSDENDKNAKKTKKTSMSFFTAFLLSLNNLLTKKGRTILTSFAGSIGIIGIALIFAVSNGTNKYIEHVQETTLSSYPLTIESESVDISALIQTILAPDSDEGSNDNRNPNAVYKDELIAELVEALGQTKVTKNDLVEFKKHIDSELKNPDSDLYKALGEVRYDYDLNLCVYTKNYLRDENGNLIPSKNSEGETLKDENGNILYEYNIIKSDTSVLLQEMLQDFFVKSNIMTEAESNSMFGSSSMGSSSMFTMGSMNMWQELLPNSKNNGTVSDMLKDQYEFVDNGGYWPEKENEIVLVVNKDNEIDDLTLYALGLLQKDDIDKIIETAAQHMNNLNSSSSSTNTSTNTNTNTDTSSDSSTSEPSWTFDEIKSKTYKVILPSDFYVIEELEGKTYVLDKSNDEMYLSNLYENSAIELKITGIIRLKEGVDKGYMSGAIGYTNLLTKRVIEEASKKTDDEGKMTVIGYQEAHPTIDVLTMLPFKSNSESFSDIEKSIDFVTYINTLSDAKKEAVYNEIYYLIKLNEQIEQEIENPETGESETTTITMLEKEMQNQYKNVELAGGSRDFLSMTLLTLISDHEKELYTISAKVAYDKENGAGAFDNLLSIPFVGQLTQTKLIAKELGTQYGLYDEDKYTDADLQKFVDPIVKVMAQEKIRSDAQSELALISKAQKLSALDDILEEAKKANEAIKSFETDEDKNSDEYKDTMAIIETIAGYYDNAITFSESTYESNLIKLGKADEAAPTAIHFYTPTFEQKDDIKKFIDNYNNKFPEDSDKRIQYSDFLGDMMKGITTIINAISYVLIAFVATSLIVSSIMIGVITLISVQERTKEIGVLRAMGASKRDVSRVFNAETLIVGFAAGVIGILITLILTAIINVVLLSLTGLVALKASLGFWPAILLIAISMGLTLIAGLIPSRVAAKKDPVIALRTE